MDIAFVFLLGISIGSFLNVLIDRIPRDESVFGGRSYCEGCKKNLRWYDLIPLLSFLWLKGKCRYCKSAIPLRIFIVEFLTGSLFIFIYQFIILQGNSEIISSLFLLLFFLILFVVFFIDFEQGIIPDKLILIGVVVAIVNLIFNLQFSIYNQIPIYNYLLSGVGGFLFFLLIFLITKGKGIGFGDVKLVFLMGLFLGFPKIISALYLAFLTGAIISLILVVAKKKRFKGGTIPFGPFLVLGAFISYFFGDFLIKIFLNGLF